MKKKVNQQEEKLSLRKYAAIIGVSHTAVAKAVRNGYINKGWDAVAKKILVELANNEWGNGIKERLKSENLNAIGNISESLINKTSLTEKDLPPIKSDITFSEARRRKEIYNAEIARITAFKEQGLYVEKENVYKQLYEFGKQIRIEFESMPDRIIDSILAAKSRHEGHTIMINAIQDVLNRLTNIPSL